MCSCFDWFVGFKRGLSSFALFFWVNSKHIGCCFLAALLWGYWWHCGKWMVATRACAAGSWERLTQEGAMWGCSHVTGGACAHLCSITLQPWLVSQHKSWCLRFEPAQIRPFWELLSFFLSPECLGEIDCILRFSRKAKPSGRDKQSEKGN